MPELLAIDALRAGYGEAVVLPSMSLTLGEGQVLALLGRNGTGKTTLINSIVGITRRFGGTVALGGQDITAMRPDQRARAGIGWVPQERNIFRSLTVEENMTAVAQPGPWTVAKVYEMFPRLKERRNNFGNQLSSPTSNARSPRWCGSSPTSRSSPMPSTTTTRISSPSRSSSR